MAGELREILEGTTAYLQTQTFNLDVKPEKRWVLDASKEEIGPSPRVFVSWIEISRKRDTRRDSLYGYRTGVYVVASLAQRTYEARTQRIEELVYLRDQIEGRLLDPIVGMQANGFLTGFLPDPSEVVGQPFNAENIQNSVFDSEIQLNWIVAK